MTFSQKGQSGLRSIHSTVTALLKATDWWAFDIDRRNVNGIPRFKKGLWYSMLMREFWETGIYVTFRLFALWSLHNFCRYFSSKKRNGYYVIEYVSPWVVQSSDYVWIIYRLYFGVSILYDLKHDETLPRRRFISLIQKQLHIVLDCLFFGVWLI